MRALAAAVMVSVWAGGFGTAHAFCGFYVSGADASLYNDATMVVMMREGTRTVLSMQNGYQGPPEAFALVVPVPVVLDEENVKTLSNEVFERVDSLAAPRLVEYWEQDPCGPNAAGILDILGRMTGSWNSPVSPYGANEDFGVTIEAEFEVGEYDIVILSAEDSGGLDGWLRANEYDIPDGAEPVLRPYVEQGTKFFVAKVSPDRVTFENGRAVLSPLRFHYDSETFSLPVRLGLLNSQGSQDLIVHILAPGQRYEVANYENATIPTNILVNDETRDAFGGFYDALFEEVRARHSGAVVTEYSWDATSCDPCPVPALSPSELDVLGGDVIESSASFVLTRLHHRYEADQLDEDLVFRAAPPIVGGRGMPDREGRLAEQVATEASGPNSFQGRYAILHEWEGAIKCDEPERGYWGGPPNADSPDPIAARGGPSLAPAPVEPVSLASLVAEDLGALLPGALRTGGVLRAETRAADEAEAEEGQPEPEPGEEGGGAAHAEDSGCGGCAAPGRSSLPGVWLAAAVLFALRRR